MSPAVRCSATRIAVDGSVAVNPMRNATASSSTCAALSATFFRIVSTISRGSAPLRRSSLYRSNSSMMRKSRVRLAIDCHARWTAWPISMAPKASPVLSSSAGRDRSLSGCHAPGTARCFRSAPEVWTGHVRSWCQGTGVPTGCHRGHGRKSEVRRSVTSRRLSSASAERPRVSVLRPGNERLAVGKPGSLV